jgi:adenylate cyclase
VLRLETEAVGSRPPSLAPIAYSSARKPDPPRLSVLVALMRIPGAVAEDEYLAEAITDDITTDLSQTAGSFVAGRAETLRRIGDGASPRDIARELGVNYVVQGGIRATSERIAANMQLIDAQTGGLLWAERFDIDRGGTAGERSEIIGRLVRTLSVRLSEDENRRIEAVPPSDWTPYDRVMRGRAFICRPISPANRNGAIRWFEQALDGD